MQQNSKMSTEIFNPPPYSSIFFNSSPSPPPLSPPPSSSTRTAARITAGTANNLNLLMAEHKDLINRHVLCLNQLRKTFKESETLRQENTNLRLANAELSDQVNLLIRAAIELEDRNRYQTASFEENNGGWSEGFSESQSPVSMAESQSQGQSESQSPIEDEKGEEVIVELPKSISVRSNGYLKIEDSSVNRPVNTTRVQASTTPVNGPKKVYVRGGIKDGPIELDVYNQGMFKTELCNKWQETGSCPYGDHCQFAHGIDELRPVIRHPRYKTEGCRMVLAGDPCPYGHRCHFRHALTEQEKRMLQLRLE